MTIINNQNMVNSGDYSTQQKSSLPDEYRQPAKHLVEYAVQNAPQNKDVFVKSGDNKQSNMNQNKNTTDQVYKPQTKGDVIYERSERSNGTNV